MRSIPVALAAVLATTACGAGSGDPAPAVTTPARPPAPRSPADYTLFKGEWSGHGNAMTVAADGTFSMAERTYRWCTETSPPCDSDVNGNITDGAVAHGRLESVSGTVATGTITTTTDNTLLPTGPVAFALDTSNDLIRALNVNWCGSHAPPGVCD